MPTGLRSPEMPKITFEFLISSHHWLEILEDAEIKTNFGVIFGVAQGDVNVPKRILDSIIARDQSRGSAHPRSIHSFVCLPPTAVNCC